MIRYVRPSKYAMMPLNDVYRVDLEENFHSQNGSENAVSCPVDALTPMVSIRYIKNSIVHASLHTILSPVDNYNPGWDHLIFFEAFPRGIRSRKRFTLPVFIHNKFRKDGASAKLDIATVTNSVAHCKTFLDEKCTFSHECNLIPKKTPWFRFGYGGSEHFIVVFVAPHDFNKNTVTDAPSNVIFCYKEELDRLYGPTLSGYVKYLVPDLTLYACSVEVNDVCN